MNSNIISIKNSINSRLWRIKKRFLTLLLRFKYFRTIRRLRKVYGKRKIIVAFGVSEIAKWKAQSLYDRLEQTTAYSPIIFIYPSPIELEKGEVTDQMLEEKINFFRRKNMRAVTTWDSATQKCIIPKDVLPDIIFYQQPWDTPPFLLPIETADYALSFYIPYYLVNNFDINLELGLPLHRQIFGHIVQNEQTAKFFTSKLIKRRYAGKCLGLGHTIVDTLTTKVPSNEKDCIIYAPHYSFPVEGLKRLLIYSTFLDNGKLILEFAKQHPEIRWVFKPHPRLRFELEDKGVWTKEEIKTYYEEWAKIGVVCTTSDYVEYFQNSLAMITDCGSFLTEYSCMDKPLIRLYYHKENLPPNPILEKLYSTFYYAHNNDELSELLELIICKKEDPNKNERHKEVTSLGLNRNDSALKIINYLDSLLARKKQG